MRFKKNQEEDFRFFQREAVRIMLTFRRRVKPFLKAGRP